MQGRIEMDEKIREKIEVKLSNEPRYLSDWFLNMQARGITMKSCADYINKVSNFFHYMTKRKNVRFLDIADIDITDLSAYFADLQYKIDKNGKRVTTSDSYRNSVWFALNKFFNYSLAVGDIQQNYMGEVKPEQNKDEPNKKKLLTADDFKKMLDCVPGKGIIKIRNIAILRLYMTTGMRKDALCAIDLEDLDLDTGELKVIDKGKKIHIYNLKHKTIHALQEWLDIRDQLLSKEDTDALFITEYGQRVGGSCMAKLVNNCSEHALGYKISPHKLRSGLCSILYSQTHDAEFVRRAVGHSKITTTQRYIVTDGEEKKKASAIMEELL